VRTGGTLNYLLGDHLGSTSLVTYATGHNPIETRYKAWGETRYASGTTPTKYQYTGQYSYVSDFGLHFYNARWYDSSLGRFAQADTIIPEQSQGVQAWDRFAYTNNNPIRYTDPSGHSLCQILVSLLGVSYSCPSSEGNWIEGFDPAPEDIELEIHIPVPEDKGLEGFDPAPEGRGPFINVPGQQDDEPEGFDPVPGNGTLGVIAENEEGEEDDNNGDDWESKKPEEGTVENPDGTTTTFIVRKNPGRDGGWSRMVIVRDENGKAISVDHEAWKGTSDPRVDPPDHRDRKPV
jgi:RHS repeat-associated protein